MLAAVLWFGLPLFTLIVAVEFVKWAETVYASLAVLLLISLALVAGIEIARRVWRRPPT